MGRIIAHELAAIEPRLIEAITRTVVGSLHNSIANICDAHSKRLETELAKLNFSVLSWTSYNSIGEKRTFAFTIYPKLNLMKVRSKP